MAGEGQTDMLCDVQGQSIVVLTANCVELDLLLLESRVSESARLGTGRGPGSALPEDGSVVSPIGGAAAGSCCEAEDAALECGAAAVASLGCEPGSAAAGAGWTAADC